MKTFSPALFFLAFGPMLVQGFLSTLTYHPCLPIQQLPRNLSGKTSRFYTPSISTLSSSKSEEDKDESKSSDEIEPREPTPSELLEIQSKRFTTAPIPNKRMDPLMASLTRIDSTTESNAPKMEVPILGEISLDGSLVVVIPTVIIALLGFVTSIQIAIQSKDEIVQTLAEVNTVLSTPPRARVTVVDPNVCRGLCSPSDQQEQVESLRKYLKGITGR